MVGFPHAKRPARDPASGPVVPRVRAVVLGRQGVHAARTGEDRGNDAPSYFIWAVDREPGSTPATDALGEPSLAKIPDYLEARPDHDTFRLAKRATVVMPPIDARDGVVYAIDAVLP